MRKGPYRAIRLEGEVLREHVGGPVIAKHFHNAWHVDNELYSRLDCDSTVSLYFERVDGTRSKVYGPFKSVSFVDGVAYVERGIFAFVDVGNKDWYCHDDGQHWPLMVIVPSD